MSDFAFAQLDKGPKQSYGKLIDLHDRFIQSKEPLMRYAAGWAAMYAAQRADQLPHTGVANTAQEIAEERWREIDHPAESMYDVDPHVLLVRAQLAIAMSNQIRDERRIWTPQQRKGIINNIATIAIGYVTMAEANHAVMSGQLAEMACLQLMWRDLENSPNLNSVPAGPAQDQRIREAARFSTDIYAYIAGSRRKVKRANVQVKARLQDNHYRRYADIIALVGANTHYAHPDLDQTSGLERSLFVIETSQQEALGERLTDEYTDLLNQASQRVHTSVKRVLELRNPPIKEVASQQTST